MNLDQLSKLHPATPTTPPAPIGGPSLPQAQSSTPSSVLPQGKMTLDQLSAATAPPKPIIPQASMKEPDLPTNIGAGLWQSAFGTVKGISDIGIKGVNLLSKIPGLGGLHTDLNTFGPSKTLERISTPQNTEQQIGKTIGDVGQFFIPGGAEVKAGKALDTLIDTAKFTEKFGPEAGNALSGILKVLGRGAVTGASTAGVTAAETGGDIQATEASGLIGSAAGGLGKALELISPGLTKALQKADFKLSPMQEAKASSRVERAAQFMTDNKILGSESTKYKKLNELNSNLESTLQKSIPDNAGVPVKEVIDGINTRVEGLRTSDPAIYKAARNEVDNAIELIKDQGGKNGTVSMQDILSGKRSYGSQAFKTSKFATVDPRVSAEGSYAVEQAYQSALESNMDRINGSIDIPKTLRSYFGGQSKVSVQDFNKVYSDAITAKNLTYTSQFKKDTGLMGRLFGLWAGQAAGQVIAPGLVGKIVGGTIGEMGATRLPSMVRNITERALSTSASTLPTVAKLGLGMFPQKSNP